MMRRLRMMQERDGEENEYEQKEAGNDADDHGSEHAEEFPTGGIAEERSVYEGKYDQEDEAGVKAESPMPACCR